jgi:hypothetical protein
MSAETFAIRVFCSNYLKTALGVHGQDCGEPGMTLRIEKSFEGRKTIFRISGGIASKQLEELKTEMAGEGAAAVLDLEHVTLVEVEGVRFLSDCEGQGIELLHCPLYIREWIAREQTRSGDSSERGSPQ